MHLHIVSFDVPYPPNYGGVIDVFYKIKALHKLGVKIDLHTFEYGRGTSKELHKYCTSVNYYKRNFFGIFSRKPFIVTSRKNKKLIKNLLKDNNPILFEGIHTTYPLINTNFKDRKIAIRSHNIEHDYYLGLAKSEKRLLKKIFFRIESVKLKKYEKIILNSNFLLAISPSEQEYFSKKYGKISKYIPVFHKEESVSLLSKKGEFAIYHGDLRVSDNIKAVRYLLRVFKKLDYPLIIASSFTDAKIMETIDSMKNVRFEFLDTVNKYQLDDLFKRAHINVLPTFQGTGIKLKLIHALFSSRFCVVTNKMVAKTGLENLCEIGDTEDAFREKVKQYIHKEYTATDIKNKEKTLRSFNTLENAQKIIDLFK